ncbi:putative vacuolar membrane protein-like protein [Emericellopsis cladophorae]|uniref:Vacuolar membrane protein-like protein n=1 Tax=Emericellopsis cladophorae TaxID=2686198 RepID=A0A9P9Y5Z7_9HYPO|nr:putative vacuolar membrane protein-like protein [Emericellopsis cladophorae]KAI6784198.1 putative vacuolar membrane protein-like protein [Emericellopsis cladophorae]
MSERLYDGSEQQRLYDGRGSEEEQGNPPPSRPTFSRGSTMHSRNPREIAAENAAKKKYSFAAFFLVVSLITFCIQTELSAYIQHDLGWGKAYCMMYFTHGSWVVLWPATVVVLKLQNRTVPWKVFLRKHFESLRATATMVETRSLDVHKPSVAHKADPLRYMARYTAIITTALTVAGLSWYVAVALTTPSDLTAIYNCSAFFAYVFSVPLLKEPLRLDKSVAVIIAIGGVLVVAYGDSKGSTGEDGKVDTTAGGRFIGNIVIGIGSVLYGLYEVLYKRYACPPEGCSPGRGVVFATTFGSLIGIFTLLVLWIPLPILHWLDIERFELPDARTGWLVLCAVLANATFSGSFLVLISLTSPVLSSVAALLTIFLVAIVDWFITGEPLSWAAIIGGTMIIVAFVGLSWSTYREMKEHEAQKLSVDLSDSDLEDGEDS